MDTELQAERGHTRECTGASQPANAGLWCVARTSPESVNSRDRGHIGPDFGSGQIPDAREHRKLGIKN